MSDHACSETSSTAPSKTLLPPHCSYAFGILLWELLTGRTAYEGVSVHLIGHDVVRKGRRPVFPAGSPPGYAALATSCWQQKADAR